MIIKPSDFSLEEVMQYNELLAGKIYLGDEIGPHTARDVVRDMEFAVSISDSETPKLTLFINSPGGGIYDAMALYDFIMQLRQTVQVMGVVRGQAASAASMLVLQATNPRVSTPSSRFLLHEPSKWGHGSESVSSAADSAEELARIHNFILLVLSGRSGKHVDVIREELKRRDVWLSATEALEWGLIDQVREW